MKKFFITLMCIVMVVCFMPTVAFADGEEVVVAKIGNVNYTSLAGAIAAANSAEGEGEVTVEITKNGTYEPFTISP